MLDISTGKVVRVIALAREFGAGNERLRQYISGLNEDEQIGLVALTWIGRQTFAAEELDEAKQTAQMERVAPTEDYLGGMPELATFLEDGMDELGISVADAEDDLRTRD